MLPLLYLLFRVLVFFFRDPFLAKTFRGPLLE